MGPITGRSVVVTGDDRLADELLDGLDALGVAAIPLECTFESEDAVREAIAAADARLHGIDQVVHTWLAPGLGRAATFRRPHRRRVGRRVRTQPRRRVVAGARQRGRRCGRAQDHSCSSFPPSAWPAPPTSRCWRRSPKACACSPRRAVASGGSTVRPSTRSPPRLTTGSTPTPPTRSPAASRLSTPAFGGHGSAADDLAPLIALLDDPDAHFLTAATLVADGGTWVGL